MCEKESILLSDIFLFSTESFITSNELLSLKNVAVYQRDADNESCISEDILGAAVLLGRHTSSM